MATKVLNFTKEFQEDVRVELAMKAQAEGKKPNTYTEQKYLEMIRRWRNGDLKDTVTLLDCYNKQKGAIITYSSKQALKSSKGTRQTDLMAIVAEQPTHWCSNSYLTGKLKHQHGVLGGNTKNNLLQINVFTIDVDTKKTPWQTLLKNSKKIGLDPLVIIETDHGYQLIYSIKGALHLNGGSRLEMALKSATRTFENLRWKLKSVGIEVDQCCHPFGVCRFPQRNRVLYINVTNNMTYDEWKDWSYRNDHETQLKNNRSFALVSGSLHGWARALLNFKGLQQGDRNTALYTVSLEYRSTGASQDVAERDLTEWMQEQGLAKDEILNTIASAYRSEYKPNPKYYKPIMIKYCITAEKDAFKPFSSLNDKQRKAYFALCKPKKAREERQRTHDHEWADDIVAWIKGNPGTKTSYRALSAELGIPGTTFDRVIKSLKESGKISVESRKGRYGYIVLTLVEVKQKKLDEPQNIAVNADQSPLSHLPLPQRIENANDLSDTS